MNELLFKMQASGTSKNKTKLFVSSADSDNVSIIMSVSGSYWAISF